MSVTVMASVGDVITYEDVSIGFAERFFVTATTTPMRIADDANAPHGNGEGCAAITLHLLYDVRAFR
jgi:hypothetical protein